MIWNLLRGVGWRGGSGVEGIVPRRDPFCQPTGPPHGGKPADVGIIQWRIHLVKQAERRRIQPENRKHERHGRQGLFAAGQQVNARDPLSGRPRHDTHTGRQQVFAGEATRLIYGTEEAQEGRDQFLEKREPDWSDFPYHY